MLEKIRRWYRQGLWTEKMVRDAEEKGVLHAGQVKDILEGKGHEAE